MEKGILEVGEYVLCSEVHQGNVLCQVMEIIDDEDGCCCLLRPTKYYEQKSTRLGIWKDLKTLRYIQFDNKKHLPPQPSTWVFHRDYREGTKQIFVQKILPKCGLFIGTDLGDIPYKNDPFTFEGVLLEPLPATENNTVLTDEEISKLHQKIDGQISFGITKKAINEAAKIAPGCCFDNESIVRQKERVIAFQVRFLTDDRLCELRKRLGEAYENARVVGFVRKDGEFELNYDNVSQRAIDKIVEKIVVYTKQNFPELIIEE